MAQVQHYGASIVNVMTFFVTLLCASQVYASCTYSLDSTDCTPTSTPTSTIIGVAIGGIVLVSIMGVVYRIRRQALQRRAAQTTFVCGTPNNNYGRRQSNVYHSYPTQSRYPPGLQSSRPVSGQVNSLNRQGMTLAPSFPQPSYPPPMAHSARTRSPTMPSLTHHSYSNQTPHVSPPSSPNSTHLLPPLSPSTYSRVSADPSTVQTPSISVTPVANTPVERPSPSGNMEMRPLTMNTGVENDEPPPAYTPI